MAKEKKEIKKKEIDVFSELDKAIKDQYEEIVDMSKVDTKVETWYDSGVYVLNYAMSKNLKHGLPAGRIVSYTGLKSTGKSLLAATAMRDPKLDMIILLESEGGGNSGELIEFAGVDKRKVRTLKASTFMNYRISKKDGKIEEIADEKFPKSKETSDYVYREGATRLLKKMVNTLEFNPKLKDAKIMIVLDSLGNLQSIRELQGGYDMGKRGQEINNFFKTFDVAFERTNILFLYTNKLYTNMGNQWDPYVESGGVNVQYNPSLTIDLSEISATDDVSDSEMKDEKERRKSSLGNSLKTIRGKIKKSRFGTEGRNAWFLFDFSIGPDRVSGLFTLLKDFGIITGNRTYSIKGWNNDKSFYKKDFIKLVLKDEEKNIQYFQKLLDEREEELKEERRNRHANDLSEISTEEDSENIDNTDDDFEYDDMKMLIEKEEA